MQLTACRLLCCVKRCSTKLELGTSYLACSPCKAQSLGRLHQKYRKRLTGNRASAKEQNSVSMDGLIRLVLVGDVHRAWDSRLDTAALEHLNPDAAIFVGDFGEEVVSLVSDIAGTQVPKAVILGNHDAWGPLYLGGGLEKVRKQLEVLGDSHLGYSSKRFKAAGGQHFAVVGGRPFSDGNASLDPVTHALYNLNNMRESAEMIQAEVLRQVKDEPVIVIGHNGPQGLGSQRHDPCGKDFDPRQGDYGDADLKQAIDSVSSSGRSPALVTFGHMHQSLNKGYGAGLRNMVHIDEETGVVYLNCAVVPRHRRVPGRGNQISHFVVVTLEAGVVTNAENVWLGLDKEGACYQHRAEALITSEVKGGHLIRNIHMAFDSTWKQFRTQVGHTSPPHTNVEL